MTQFNGSETGTFEAYKPPKKWEALFAMVFIWLLAAGLLWFLLRQ